MESVSERSAPTPEEEKPDYDDQKKNNRACDFCHRMKMKCIGKENPPCNRCRQSQQACTFDGPRKSKASKVEDRLKVVEEQMSVVQSSLAELISLQRNGLRPQSTEDPTPHDHLRMRSKSAHSTEPTRSLTESISRPQPSFFAASGYSSPTRLPGPQPPKGYDGAQRPSWIVSRPSSDSRPHSPKGKHSPPPADSSAIPSDDEMDDPLEPSHVIYNNMLSLAEAARLKADGHMVVEGDKSSRAPKRPKDKSHPFDFDLEDDDEPRKRPRHADDVLLRRAMPMLRGDHVSQFKNPMEMGFCSMEKGEQLFNMFMEGGEVYVPIFDPKVDTWKSLCKRSPFSVTALIMVGSKIEDAGGPPSELQRKCRDHAEMIGEKTLFSPLARIEVLQAMIVLSAWGDTSWRPGGHALRIAMDMGLYRCLPYLSQTGMGAGKTAAELEEERPLVVGARLWLALYKSEFEMAFNLGRPALFAAEDTIKAARRFLDHPLTIQTDSRLVATCELLTARMPLHQPFSIWPSLTRIPNLDAKIREANEAFVAWLQYWEDYYEKHGVPKSSFLRESLITQYSHAVLHTNSRILHGVRSRRDVSLLSEHRQHWLREALRSAQTLVTMALRGQAYAHNFAKANYYTHVGVAFASRMVIRLTTLMPECVDTRQTGRDLEAVTKILARVPGFQFAQEIREIIIKARRKHILPPPSKAPSPTSGNTPLPELWEAPPPSTSASQVTASPDGLPLDFFLADQLFTTGGNAGVGTGVMEDMPMIDSFSFDQWFPYPPLDGDTLPPVHQVTSPLIDTSPTLAPRPFW